jgi:hypothetical protein
MQVEQAKFKTDDHLFILLVILPEIETIRLFAQSLHARGEPWSGLFEGWPASYTPEDRTRRPAHSRMTFIPAEFFIGDSRIWHVAITWEDGRDEPPVELENRRGVGGESRVLYLNEAVMKGQNEQKESFKKTVPTPTLA